MMNKLRELFDNRMSNDYSEIFESRETFNNGDFDYKVIIAVDDFAEWTGNEDEKIYVKAVAVRLPSTFSEEKQHDIKYCFGLEDEEEYELTPYEVYDYGLYGNLEVDSTPYESWDEAIQIGAEKLAEKLDVFNSLLGFYLDRPMNQLGNTGWDFMAGEIGLKTKKQ